LRPAARHFPEAVRLQQDAIREASRYDLPTGPLQPELKAYREGRTWIESA